LKTVVIDASVAIKWAVAEPLSEQALWVLSNARLIAPDLLIAECANILWKKVARGQIDNETAIFAAGGIMKTDIELLPMRQNMAAAVKLAIDLNHPAYDCLYLALAVERDCKFVTADTRLINKLSQSKDKNVTGLAIPLADAPMALEEQG